MPITFEPAQPVAPGASAGYGAAQIMQANNPLFVRQQEMAMQYQLQAAGIAAQQQAAAQANASHQEGIRAQRDMAQAQLEREGQVTPAQAFAADAQMALQAQHADLAVWANSQEMTAAEALRLQREKAAVGDIMNRQDWTDQEKADAVTLLRTRIDPAEQRLKATQQKHIQSQMQLETQRAMKLKNDEMAQSKLDAQTFEERTRPILSDAVLNQVRDEFDQMFPGMADDPDGAQMRDAWVKAETAARPGGIAGRMYQSEPGKWVQLKTTEGGGLTADGAGATGGTRGSRAAAGVHPSGLSGEQYRKEYADAYKRVQKIADKEAEEQGKPDLRSRERIKQDTEDDMAAQGLPRNFEEYAKQMPKPAEGRKPWGGRFKLPGQGDQGTPPAGAVNPKDPIAGLGNRVDAALASPQTPPDRRHFVAVTYSRIQELMQKDPKTLTDDDKEELRNLAQTLDKSLSAPGPSAPLPSASPAAPPPAPAGPSRFQRFTRGDLITTEDLGALGRQIREARQGIVNASPFRRFAGFR